MANPEKNMEIRVGLATVEPFRVVGISIITTNENDKAAEDINALWERFFSESVGQNLTARADDVIYAVYSDYEGDHTKPYRITIGYRVPEDYKAPEGFHSVSVEGGDYGILSAQGQQPQALIQTWEAIWGGDLDRALKTDFELYGQRFFETGVHEVLVHVGLKDQAG